MLSNPNGNLTSAGTYTGTGQTCSSSANWITQNEFSYDAMGRTKASAQCNPVNCPGGTITGDISISYGYDDINDLTSLAESWDATTLTYSYDATPSLTEVTSSLIDGKHPGTLVSVNPSNINPLGEPTSVVVGDGYTRTLSYDKRGRLVSQTDSGSIYGLSISYAPNGNVAGANDSVNGTWTYGYDDFSRLNASSCTASCPNGSSTQAFSYKYDQFGNRWQQNVTAGSGTSTQYAFNSSNQISGSGVTYDAAGNMTADGVGDTFTYDAENRLVSVGGDYSLAYVYDAIGNRVEETNGFTSEGVVYDLDGRALRTFTSGGAVVTEEGYAGSNHLFTYTSSGYTQFRYSDWLDSLRALTTYGSSGDGHCVNLAFGDGQSCSGTQPADTNLFTDERTDPGGLLHFLARQYSPLQGRWGVPDLAGRAAADAANPQSWNRYSYVLSNPLTLTDPSGLCEASQTTTHLCLPNQDDGTHCSIDGFGAPCSMLGISPAGIGTTGLVWIPSDNVTTHFGPGSGDSSSGMAYGGSDTVSRTDAGEWVIVTIGGSQQLQAQAPPQSQAPPWYKNSCVTGALGKGALSVGIDSIGLIPEAGGVARIIGHQAGYVGVVADQAGSRLIGAVDATANTGRGLAGLTDTSPTGLASTGLTIAGFIPGLNDAAAVGSIGLDLFRTAKAIRACY